GGGSGTNRQIIRGGSGDDLIQVSGSGNTIIEPGPGLDGLTITGGTIAIRLFPGDVPAGREEAIPCRSGVTIEFKGFPLRTAIPTGTVKETQSITDPKTRGTYLINVTDTTGCKIERP
ncbi:MAG: hypothetical protein K6T71_08315, partial [Candidatus Bipolaricaulota bacterium]|nr:hypothetical protein [Candidatus Bipolaricaulota bacterium]